MVRLGAGVRAGALATALIGAGCGGPAVDPQQALEAFRSLATRDGLTYRFEVVVLADGSSNEGSTQAVGAVAGTDSAYRLTLNQDANGGAQVSDTVISGQRAFRRSGTLPWEATSRPDGFAEGDLATFLPIIGSADLGVVGRVDFDGASRIQLTNLAPIPLASGDEDEAMLTRLEVLIGDDGTPVRAVGEFDPAAGDTDLVVIEFRFADFGAEISIQPPDIP